MSKDPAAPPSPDRPPKRANPAPEGGRDTREDRLKAALKANMARRKAQARARASDSGRTDNEN
ncbi:hypothetical protein E7811_03455 [Aliigemmobacter aestuarii]|uniref:Uncharacterized protein n=1 Tax=Aliigemmobacter aestuarii TaxID=1445661 RepID=A0A4S3MSH0_9RHOB|nr:hypothetical protein [Gemmobacter aestuarii]THD84795.1 hypothetical protein E7811_03455 [Gemmobacter aestuarii]